jgi:hypothetical protein
VASGPIHNGFFESNPDFRIERGMTLQAHYLGEHDHTPCDSQLLDS